ncbi:hypothetical protein B0X55_00260, partial [Helicobacter pylori]
NFGVFTCKKHNYKTLRRAELILLTRFLQHLKMLMHSFQTPKILGISCLNGFKFFIKSMF